MYVYIVPAHRCFLSLIKLFVQATWEKAPIHNHLLKVYVCQPLS